ncbi:nuclear transport factor 2 family protein [Luteipulveratus mongoliensis]|nr:nuclear transport factor 2 family protein [Luteipulveratus mongoliensis]
MTNASETMRELAAVIDARDWARLQDLLTPDFRGRYVHTGETFDGEGFVALNRDYPGVWRFVLEDAVGDGDRAAGRSTVFNDDEEHHVATFLTVRDGLVSELVEVWAETVDAPSADRRPEA